MAFSIQTTLTAHFIMASLVEEVGLIPSKYLELQWFVSARSGILKLFKNSIWSLDTFINSKI